MTRTTIPARLRRTVAVSTLALAALAVAPALPANAAVPAFQLPFPCGQKWQLNSWAHAPALDMVKEPDQVGTEGALLVAPAGGTVRQSYFHQNAGNMIQIDHGGGHFTTYIHLQSRAVNVGARVQEGQTIGRVGATGPTSNGHPHLHYEQGFDANGDGRVTWGAAGTERVIATFNGVQYGQSNGRQWDNVTSANSCQSVTPVDGRLYREPSGTIAVIAGGAPVRFASMDELRAAGYGSAPLIGVPAGWLNSLPQEPRDGTFLRDAANGAISVIAGGAKYGLTLAEWEAMGRPGSINVPLRVINEYGRIPADGTLLRNHTDGAISVVAGGAKYGLSLAQWERLGKPASVNVPIGFINTLGSDPRPGTLLRDVANGSIYLTIGGAKYGLTWAEYERLDNPPFANVPIEWINTFRAIPRDGSYLRNVEDGTIYVMTGGKKDALSYEEWDRLGKPASTNVPVGFLNQIPSA
ncbi:M23 family metallopeptidase [Nonomuraea jiangxiensis]|uniref:Peptidase family M23 n=1 Tax=Nonomuraea jiangxiensis TaxID=633440 RepID=A0A1G8Q5C4_9ACTN|nr:M23 family metallopeptidase [Nonomuraea jiangxiensis]SDI99964.1 Peptidase family M23 [Nonomuraea jiangxiensis]